MALNDIIKQQVGRAFTSILAPGGLSESVTVKFFVSAGTFDVEADTAEPVWNDVTDVVSVITRPSADDAKNHAVLFTDAKLIIPGPFLPAEPQADTDKVIRANGEVWDIRKVVGVPGQGVWIIYIFRN